MRWSAKVLMTLAAPIGRGCRGVVLSRSEWVAAASAHRARISRLLGGRPGDVCRDSASNPFQNFVFQYCKNHSLPQQCLQMPQV